MDHLITAENNIKHLCSVANALGNSRQANILKSYYLMKSRILALSASIKLPQRFCKSTIRCPRCCVQYEDGPASFLIKPKRKQTRFERRLLKQDDEKKMTSFQQKYFNRLKRKGIIDSHNSLNITCGICKHKTTEPLKKPIQVAEEVVTPAVVVKSNKKKKRKDRFSGLNKEIVLSASSQTNKYTPLVSTPIIKAKQEKMQQKQLFSQKKIMLNNTIERKSNKDKQIRIKNLKNILKDSKQKKSPSVTLKHFLNSI